MKNSFKGTLALALIILACASLLSWAQAAHALSPVKDIRSLSDFNRAGVRLGAIPGDPADSIYQQDFPNAEVVYANSSTDRALMLETGKIDGYLAYGPEIPDLLGEYPTFVRLPQIASKSPYGFFAARNKHGEEVISQFNHFFARRMQGGKYEEIEQKWMGADENVKIMPDFTFTGENGPLNIICIRDAFPQSYERAGQTVGFVVEVAYQFCEEYGYMPILSDVPWDASVTGVTTGKYDLCAATTIISEERREKVLFSEPISYRVHYMIVRRDSVAPGLLAEIDAPAAADGEEKNLLAAFWDGLVLSFQKDVLRESRWKMLLDGLIVTVRLSAYAAVFGTALGALICFLRLRKNRFVRAAAAVYVKIFQGTPIVVLLLVLYYVVFASADIEAFDVCVIGFSLDFASYVSEMMRAGIQAVPAGQKRAALALGYGPKQAFFEIVLPQAMRHILPVYKGQFVSMVKLTSVAGYISVEDLTKVSDIIRSRTYEAFFPLILTAVAYFLLANFLMSALNMIQIHTDPFRRKRIPKGGKPA